MSVVDERWKAVHDHHIDAWDLTIDNQDETMIAHRGGFLTSDDPGYDEARAKLAAQAPAMARLLLAKGIDDTDEYGYRCICCGPSHAGVGVDDSLAGFVHHRECALATVLRAAGVL